MTDIGIVGLGVMGRNLSLNIERNGFSVAVFERETTVLEDFVLITGDKRIIPASTPRAFVASVVPPRKIILLVKAGAPVDWTIDLLRSFLEAGDILIDGGNSFFRDTERRQQALASNGIHLIGSGISGGEKGALLGPSLMPGGDKSAYEAIKPIWESIAAKTDDGPCVTYVGPGGSGHFVKMMHNGIEYGDMQLLAEAYDILRKVVGLTADEIATIFDGWQQGELQSYLLEIAARVLRVKDPETGLPLVDLILDKAGQKGTGKWASQISMELGTATPTLDAAVLARNLSAQRDERLIASKNFPPQQRHDASVDKQTLVGAIHDALLASRICAYAQGMNLIRAASDKWNWNINLAEIARIWRGGCIIRARLLKSIMHAYREQPKLVNLLLDERVKEQMAKTQDGLRMALATAQLNGVPVPAMAASLSYFDLGRSAELPMNLTQAQRDFFGAHTYERTDKLELGSIHTNWEDDA